MALPRWHRYEQLRPDQLVDAVSRSPVALWPLGLLEHHGWHLPVGFDGIKADHICQRVAARTGGVILPVMWWGAGGGHGPFRWTHYQEAAASASILGTTVRQLIDHGFRALVLLAGHYPWQSVLDQVVPPIRRQHPDILILAGTEVGIGGEHAPLTGDHAALEETSFGLALFPGLVDMGALRPGRGDDAWPQGHPPPEEGRHPGVCFDPDDARFAQFGEDARRASAEHGEEGLDQVVDYLASAITDHLSAT